MRERGLKSSLPWQEQRKVRRSREGAWIEIFCTGLVEVDDSCRSREGAWIEIGNPEK